MEVPPTALTFAHNLGLLEQRLEDSYVTSKNNIEQLDDAFQQCLSWKQYFKQVLKLSTSKVKPGIEKAIALLSSYQLKYLRAFYQYSMHSAVIGDNLPSLFPQVSQSDSMLQKNPTQHDSQRVVAVLGCADLQFQNRRLFGGLFVWLASQFPSKRVVDFVKSSKNSSMSNSSDSSHSDALSTADIDWDGFVNSSIKIALCGGGFSSQTTEAGSMLETVLEEVPKEKQEMVRTHILLEEDSLDTVGNGVFLRKSLQKKFGWFLDNECRGEMLVVTSTFHSIRSLQIFKRVFGNSCKVAVLLVDTLLSQSLNASPHRPIVDIRSSAGFDCHALHTSTEKKLGESQAIVNIDAQIENNQALNFAQKELLSEHRAAQEIFGTPLGPVIPGDVDLLLLHLLQKHDLYKHRYDILRKYQ